jgi:hypothetical protein
MLKKSNFAIWITNVNADKEKKAGTIASFGQ